MEVIFEHVDKTKFLTGLLSDYGQMLVDIEASDGIPRDSNYVDIDTWRLLYGSLLSFQVNSAVSLPSLENVSQQLEKTANLCEAVPLAIMNYRYNRYREDAVENALVRVENNRIYDEPGMDPYEERCLFAVASLKLYFPGPAVSFVF